jgi:valyl-tRNA synthetase
MLHPFIPFVTEETWSHLKRAAGETFSPHDGWPEALIIAPWPEAGDTEQAAEADMGLAIELIRGIRNVRSEYNVQPGRRVAALIAGGDHAAMLAAQRDVLTQLARLDPDQLAIQPAIEPPHQVASIVVGGVTCYLPLAGLIDLEAERARLGKELDEVVAVIARSEKQLAGPFAQKAPPDVVQRERDKLADLQQRREQLEERLNALS